LVLAYNLGVVGHVAGAYGLVGKPSFFEHDLLSGILGLLFSPARGLFVFSPFLLFVPFALGPLLRHRNTSGLTAILGVAVLLQLLLYAKADWRQGASWGPRWFTDVLPILVWMLVPVVSMLTYWGHLAFVLTCGAAIAIQTIGAFWYIGSSDAAIYAIPAGPNAMRAAWTIRIFPSSPSCSIREHPPS
jgi:hypothetical protein